MFCESGRTLTDIFAELNVSFKVLGYRLNWFVIENGIGFNLVWGQNNLKTEHREIGNKLKEKFTTIDLL